MAKQLAIEPRGRLFFGDNLDVLARFIPDEVIDLVYLDPPFNSNKGYNLFATHKDGRASSGQQKAFDDFWEWGAESKRMYDQLVEAGGPVSRILRAFREFLDTTDMLAYLTMMAPRLIEIRRVMKPSASLYLHCDPNASHYLKLLLDAVFGPKCFRNEIIWSYRRWPSPAKRYQRMHDVILFYARESDGPATFNVEYEPNSTSYTKRFKGKTQVLDPHTRTRKIVRQEDSKGLPRRDVWDISIIAGFSKERVGFPTQKPMALLERIVSVSSNEGDLILDPFCGCGTAIDAAQKLHRRWIGVDITRIAIETVQERIKDRYGAVDYVLDGTMSTIDEAFALAELDKHAFQQAVCERLGIVAEVKKGADRGIDGEIVGIYENDDTWRALVSVKGGKSYSVEHVRDLVGTLTREQADFGILVTLKPPTGPMKREAADAGFTDDDLPRVQLLTVSEMLDGKKPLLPGRIKAVRPSRRLRVV
jgi:DNA modification methylase